MKRPRQTPAEKDRFHFSLSNGHAFHWEQHGKDTDYDECDTLSFILHFRPALTQEQASCALLKMSYTGNKDVAQEVVFCQPVWPPSNQQQAQWLTFRPGELEFVCFETHQLAVGQKSGTFSKMYVVIENRQCENGPLKLGPLLDLKHTCLPKLLPQCEFLRWFPPDLDPQQWGLRIDSRKVPQRTPFWAASRGEFSGSSSYVAVGYFANKNSNGNSQTFINPVMRGAMRLGAQSEDLIILAYISHFAPHVKFEEVGSCSIAGHPGWTASPDGCLYNDTMKWEHLPLSSPIHDSSSSTAREWDITRGACEFKTSRTKLCMEAYFYPQLYMEMMALDALWADLTRYRPSKTWNASQRRWDYQDVMHVYRVFRDSKLESWFLRIWKANKGESADPEDKRLLREHLENLAATATPIAIIDATGNPILSKYRKHCERLLKPFSLSPAALARANAPEKPFASPPGWLAIEARTSQLAEQIRQGVALDKRLLTSQIKAYADLLHGLQ